MVAVSIERSVAAQERLLYGWKAGTGMGGLKATVAAEILYTIEDRDGAVTPAAVVSEAKAVTSPLHPKLEWNDKAAAQQYRLVQAAQLIRALVVVRRATGETPSPPVRAFVRVFASGEDDELDPTLTATGHYTSILRTVRHADARERLLQQASADLALWRRRYDGLEQFAGLYPVIDEALEGEES